MYHKLILHHVARNNAARAYSIISRMKADNVEPTAETYSYLMRAYVEQRQNAQVERMFEAMCLQGIKPNLSTYMHMINALGKQKKIERISQIITGIRKHNYFYHLISGVLFIFETLRYDERGIR
jgi:pentatricopeptide repeat protein